MPRFYFDLHNNEEGSDRDEVGVDLNSSEAAAHAIRAVSDVLRDAPPQTEALMITVTVRDESRATLLKVSGSLKCEWLN